MGTKSLFSSKTFWMNAIAFSVEIFQSLADTQVVPEQWILVGLPIANIVMRWITKDPVTLTGN